MEPVDAINQHLPFLTHAKYTGVYCIGRKEEEKIHREINFKRPKMKLSIWENWHYHMLQCLLLNLTCTKLHSTAAQKSLLVFIDLLLLPFKLNNSFLESIFFRCQCYCIRIKINSQLIRTEFTNSIKICDQGHNYLITCSIKIYDRGNIY